MKSKDSWNMIFIEATNKGIMFWCSLWQEVWIPFIFERPVWLSRGGDALFVSSLQSSQDSSWKSGNKEQSGKCHCRISRAS